MNKCLIKILLSLLIICFISLNEYATSYSQDTIVQNKYPSLRKIANVFAQNYDLEDYDSDDFYRFRFIKNPSGWYVVPEYFSGKKRIKLDLWNAESGYPTHIDPNKSVNDFMLSEFISNSDLYDYAIHPFYGYPGWMDDVIRVYKDKDIHTITDNELYGLCRAYSEKASDIFWPHSLYSDFKNAKGEDALKRDIKKYIELSEKAIDNYALLLRRKPDFKTKVGLMDVKYSNEVMSKFYELKLFQYNKEAESLLVNYAPDTLYPSFWKSYANELLSQAQPNSIIFTNGDNDTYPLLWVQESENFRKDVMIINLSLLNDPKYLQLLKNGFLEAPPLKAGFTASQLEIISESVILVDPQTENMSNPSFYQLERSIISKLNDPSGIIPIDSGFNEIKYITAEGYIDTIIINNGVPGNVLSMAELLVRSLINYQAGSRNIYFTKGMQEKYRKIFQNDELTDLGLLYELGYRKESTIKFNGQLYDTTLLRSLSLQKDITVNDPAYFARTMIHNLVLEAEIILILMESDPYDYELTYSRLFDFVLDNPVTNSGVNYYYLFAIGELYQTENYRNKAIERVQGFVSELSELISDTEILDDDFRDISQLKFYQSIISTLRSNGSLITESAVEKDIELMEKIIYDRLLEFPELNFN